MANKIRVNGFWPVIVGNGALNVMNLSVLSGNSRVITQGDLVSMLTTGAETGPACTRGAAADGTILVGAATGGMFYVDSGNVARPTARIPTSTAGNLIACVDPNQQYVASGEGNAAIAPTVASQLTDANKTVLLGDGVAAVSFSTPQGTFGGISQQGLDMSTLNTTAQDIMILGKYRVAGNAFGSSTTDNLNGQYTCRLLRPYFSGARTTGL